jgi:hypothetical protein
LLLFRFSGDVEVLLVVEWSVAQPLKASMMAAIRRRWSVLSFRIPTALAPHVPGRFSPGKRALQRQSRKPKSGRSRLDFETRDWEIEKPPSFSTRRLFFYGQPFPQLIQTQ